MKQYRYVKSNAFTSGKSLGNPAACIFEPGDLNQGTGPCLILSQWHWEYR